jgi:hypothetical protein
VSPSDSTVQLLPEHERLLQSLGDYHQGDSTTVLYTRSGRVLKYWELFTQALKAPNDTTYWNIIHRQVAFDQKTNPNGISKAEKDLGAVLQAHEVKEVKKVIAQETAVAFGEDKIEQINSNTNPKFRLEDAVRELRRIREKLPSDAISQRNMIDRYLEDARSWDRFRTFRVKIQNLPGGSHLHIESVDPGTEPAWTDFNQIFAGDVVELRWKTGQYIHVALDTSVATCNFGKNPADKEVLDGKYALFDLEKGISFPNVGQTVTVSFDPPLTDRLPTLK